MKIKDGEPKEVKEAFRQILTDGESFGKYHLDISLLISTKFIDPLKSFEKESWGKYEKLLNSLNIVVSELFTNRKKLRESKQDYLQLSRNSEKSELTVSNLLTRFDRGEINKGEFERETGKASELKVFVEEAKQKYLKNVETTNMLWNKLFSNFMPFIKSIDKSEKKRRALIMGKGESFGKLRKKCFDIENVNVKVSSKEDGLKVRKAV